jgi:hypothetical protein
VAKKRVTRKPAAKAKRKAAGARSGGGDQSRLDLKPLQKHIRRRIKELESGQKPAATRRSGESDEETIERLRNALETLEDICFPSMGIPI